MPNPSPALRNQAGFSLVEMMIAIALGLLILAGVTSVFVSNNQTRAETERVSQQIENGRYAMQLLADDLRDAGYYAEYMPPTVLPSTFTAKPDACTTDLTVVGSVTAPAYLLHVQGYDNGANAPTCLSDIKSGTDILVVRRVSTCVAGSTNCDAASNGTPYFQASLCNPPVLGGSVSTGELSSSSASCPLCTDYFALDSTIANLTKHKKDCATTADLHAFVTHIYFIANNDNSGDGIPTLKRAELGPSGFTIVPLVEGIENLQLEYGIDTNDDGAPDAYTADPDNYSTTYTGTSTCSSPTAALCNWWNVVAVNIHLLARNTQATVGYSNTKTYSLGLNADGSANSVTVSDSYRRHGYEGVVRLTNPSGRRL